MARLPNTYDQRRVAAPTRAIARYDGGQVGRAMGDLGRGFQAVGNAAFVVEDRHAAEEALEKDVEVGRRINELLYNPEKGFLIQKQMNAVGARESAIGKIKAIESEALGAVGGLAAKKLKNVLARRIDAAMATIDKHTAVERSAAHVGTLRARIDLAGSDAVAGGASKALVDAALRESDATFNALAAEMGWSPEQLEVERRKHDTKVIGGIVLDRASTDPVGALEYLRTNGDRMDPAARTALELKLEPLVKAHEGREYIRKQYAGEGEVKWAAGGTRRLPVHDKVIDDHKAVAGWLGPDIGVTITSGAQPRKGSGKPRKGSVRHDHDGSGKGTTVDLKLTRNGKPVTIAQDRELYARAIEEYAARGYTGIGHYSTTIHVGGGSAAFWGPDRTSATADPYLKAAYDRGRARFLAGGGEPVHGTGAAMDAYMGDPAPTGGGVVAAIRAETDPIRRDAMLDEFKLQETLRISEHKAAQDALNRQAEAHVLAGGSVAGLDAKVLLALTRSNVMSLMDYERKLKAGTPITTDPNEWYRLNLLRADRPLEFAHTRIPLNLLSEKHRDFLIKEQVKMRSGDGASPQYGGFKSVVESMRKGLFDFNADWDTDDGKKRDALYQKWTKEIDAYVDLNGKNPGDPEKKAIMARLLHKEQTEGDAAVHFFSGGLLSEPVDTLGYEFSEGVRKLWDKGKPAVIDGKDVTKQEVKAVLSRYKARGGQFKTGTLSEGIEIYRAEMRRAASLDKAPPSPASPPSVFTASPDDGPRGGLAGGPQSLAGGYDAVTAGKRPIVDLGAPAASDRRVGTVPSTDGVTDGIPSTMPDPDDGVAWEVFGQRVGAAMFRVNGPVMLPNGMEVTIEDWALAVDRLGYKPVRMTPLDEIIKEVIREKSDNG